MGTDLFTVPHFLIILKKWLHIASLKLPISLFCPLYELFRHFYVHMHLFINFRSTFAESQGKIAEWKIIFLCKLYYVRYNFLFSGKSLETRKKDYEKGKENDVGQWSIVENSIIIFYIQSLRSKMSQMQGAVVCRFIGAFKDAHKWASYRYVSSAATKAMQQMGFFQRKLNIEGGFEDKCLKSAGWKSLTVHR